MSRIHRGASRWRHSRRLWIVAALFLAVLSGCGSEQSGLVQPNVAAVNLNITMPTNVASAAPDHRNSLWATLQQWFLPTDAWAATVNEIAALVVRVTGPDIPSPITTRQPVNGATGGQVIPITLDVPVGEDRVFTVSALNATNTTIFRGASAPTTLTVGKAANVDIPLVNITAPTANAGPNQGGKLPGTVIILDGSASSDPNGDLLTYRWTFTTRPTGSQAELANPTSVSPTFTIDRDGEYRIQLIVNDGTVDSPAVTVIVSSINVPPVADAGPNQGNKPRGSVITLDGSASSDSNGDPLTYRWTFTTRPTGSQAVLANPTSVSPTFTIDGDGDYKIQLIVNDGTVDSPPAIVTVNSVNVAPKAHAGTDQSGLFTAGTVITLNGSASSDVNGDALTYRWAFTTLPAGSQVTLRNPTSARPTFTLDRDGEYVIQLIVNDGRDDSLPDTVIVKGGEIAPVANAKPDQGGKLPGERITLNGSASSDGNGDPLTYRWAFTTRPAGSQAVLSNPTTVSPTFTIDRDGNYVVQLIVNDGTVDSPPATVTVTSTNVPPEAKAGDDQTVELPFEGSITVTLDGSSSSDANRDPLTYRWSFTSIPPSSEGECELSLDNATSVKPSFSPFCSGTYVVQLTVNDGTVDSPADTVTVTITNPNVAPVANAGPDQSGRFQGENIPLDGSASSDVNDGDSLTYLWTIIAVPPFLGASCGAVLDDPTSPTPSFSPPCRGTYEVQLIVNDGKVNSRPATVNIIVDGQLG